MELTLDRQRLLAANLANANTPGFIRRDLDFQAEFARALEAADSSRIAAVNGEVVEDRTTQPRLDGNNVVISQELNEMMQNGVAYNLLAKAFNTRINILRTAMRS
jgi:flagellar basal-body rod protein FlgB